MNLQLSILPHQTKVLNIINKVFENVEIFAIAFFRYSSSRLKFQPFNFIIFSNSLNFSNSSGDTLYIFVSTISL